MKSISVGLEARRSVLLHAVASIEISEVGALISLINRKAWLWVGLWEGENTGGT